MKLEQIAAGRVADSRLQQAAPEMLALILAHWQADQRGDIGVPASWFDKRDALLARLRKEIEQ